MVVISENNYQSYKIVNSFNSTMITNDNMLPESAYRSHWDINLKSICYQYQIKKVFS